MGDAEESVSAPGTAGRGAAELSGGRPASRWRRPALYPDIYAWFILLASLDLMLTWIILHLEGVELNVVADWIIEHYDLKGVVIYKFVLVLFVILMCELVGRRNYRRGLQLARWAVVLTAVPVLIAVIHLLTALTADLA
jgi:hypothetical protein